MDLPTEQIDLVGHNDLVSMNNMAIDLHRAGSYTEASGLQQILLRKLNELRQNSPLMLDAWLATRSNYAATRVYTQSGSAIEDYQQKTISLWRNHKGENHPGTITAEYNCSLALLRLGRFDSAISDMKKVVEKRRNIMGEDNKYTAAAKICLAWAFLLARQLDKVEEATTELLANSVLDGDPFVIRAMSSFGIRLFEEAYNEDRCEAYRMAAHSLAVKMFEGTVDRSVRVFGERDRSTLRARNNLAVALLSYPEGEEKGREMQINVANTMEVILSKDDRDTIMAKFNSAIVKHHLAMDFCILGTTSQTLNAMHLFRFRTPPDEAGIKDEKYIKNEEHHDQ
jgi:tetratricopeptide (TPR) repeat protein